MITSSNILEISAFLAYKLTGNDRVTDIRTHTSTSERQIYWHSELKRKQKKEMSYVYKNYVCIVFDALRVLPL